jgi:two-component system chemotaxis response regulator CheB
LGVHSSSKANGLERGAAEYFDIPSKHARDSDVAIFKDQLAKTIKALSAARRELGPTKEPLGPPIKRDEKRRLAQLKAAAPIPVTLRPYKTVKPEVIAIASSTGGPRALTGFIGGLPRSINCPIIITQHMLKGFTASLANGITKSTDWPCHEGVDGTELLPGYAYMAPCEYHMVFNPGSPYPKIKLLDTPAENYCKPSADPMFRSIVEVYGSKVLGVILTGMGNDGLKGAQEIINAGGNVIAQDQESSVVWGMPRAVAEAGLCAAIKPIDALPSEAARIVQGNFQPIP